MGYEIRKVDNLHHVVRTGDHVMMGSHSTRAKAEQHLRELNAGAASTTTVRVTDGVWEVVDWFSREVVATLTDESAAHTVYDIMLSSGQLHHEDFNAGEMATLGKAGKAFRNGAGEWSYPTPDASYVHKAMQAFGRSASGDRSRLKAYLKRRAAAVGLSKEEIARIDGYSSS